MEQSGTEGTIKITNFSELKNVKISVSAETFFDAVLTTDTIKATSKANGKANIDITADGATKKTIPVTVSGIS